MTEPWEMDWSEAAPAAKPTALEPWEMDWSKPARPVEGGFAASAKQHAGALVKGAGQVAADLGLAGQDNALKEYGQGIINRNPTAVTSLEGIAERPLTAVAEATGNAAMSMGGIVAARLAGNALTAAAPLTGPAAPVVAAIGQAVAWLGPAAIASLPSFGSIREKQVLNDPENEESGKAKAAAALGAATIGFIETKLGPQNWALVAFTKEGRAKLAKQFAATTLTGKVAQGVGRGGLEEGVEEIIQNPIEQAASFDDPTTPENIKETLFGGAMGAIGGGVLGGGFTGAQHVVSPSTKDVLKQPDVDSAIEVFQHNIDTGAMPPIDPSTYKDLTTDEIAANQATLLKAVENDIAFALDAEGLPTLNGAPLRTVAPQGLPTHAEAAEDALSRDEYEAVSAVAQALGKNVVVVEDQEDLPMEGFVNKDSAPDTVFISTKMKNGSVAVLGHEMEHLAGESEAHANFVKVFREELAEHANDVAHARHDRKDADGNPIALSAPKLEQEQLADITGDFWADPTAHDRVIVKMREQLGDKQAESTATTFLQSITNLIGRVKAVLTGTTFTTPDGKRLATQYVKDLERVQDALAAAIADNFIQKGYRPPGAQTNSSQLLLARTLELQRQKAQWEDDPAKTLEQNAALRAIMDRVPYPAIPFGASPSLVSALESAQKEPAFRDKSERLNIEAIQLGIRMSPKVNGRIEQKGDTVAIRLTPSENSYFEQIFASAGDKAELTETVPSIRYGKGVLTVAAKDTGALADYTDQTVGAEKGEGNSRLPPSFYKATFPPKLQMSPKQGEKAKIEVVKEKGLLEFFVGGTKIGEGWTHTHSQYGKQIGAVKTEPAARGQGYGAEIYRQLNRDAGGGLRSSPTMTTDAKRVWESLVRSGDAEDLGEDAKPRYQFKSSTQLSPKSDAVQAPEFKLGQAKSGDGLYHTILVRGKRVGHIGGFERASSDVGGDFFDVRNTELTDESLRGTGLYQKAIQQVANSYPGGVRSFEWQSSRMLKGALAKMPTYKKIGDALWILPEKGEVQLSPKSDAAKLEARTSPATPKDFTRENVKGVLDRSDWTILTAENPGGKALNDIQNAGRMRLLRDHLKAQGLASQPVRGKYGGNEEHSLIVFGASRERALEIGRKFGQESVLTRDGLVYTDRTVNPARGVNTFDTPPEDFYSTLPDGGAFSVDIDFDSRVPIDETAIAASLKPKEKAVPATKDKRTGVALTKAMRSASSEEFKYGDRLPFTVSTQAELGELLQEMATAYEAARVEDTPENREFVARVIEHEGRLALTQEGHAVGWYSKTTDAALRIAALIHPEIATDADARFAFTYALAVTSNGATIAENTRNAFTVYKSYAKNGRMPEIGFGVRVNNMKIAFRTWNDIAKKIGVAGLRDFMLTKRPVRELKKTSPDMHELISDEVYGGTIIGPKIGGAFLQNLNSNHDALAMDRWFMRTWGRITGNLVIWKKGAKTTRDAPSSGSERRYIRATMSTALERLRRDYPELTMSDLQAVLWYPEKLMYAMHGVNDESGKPTDYEIEAAKYAEQKGISTEAIARARELQPDQPARRGAGDKLGGLAGADQVQPEAESRGAERAGSDGREDGAAAQFSPKPGQLDLTGVHFSKEPRTFLSGAFYGTGMKGEEAKRVLAAKDKRLRSRVYAYVNQGKGVRPESYVGAQAHTVRMENLYDADADPLNLTYLGDNAFETAVLDAGFNGYFAREDNQGIAVLIGPAAHVAAEPKGFDYRGEDLEVPPAPTYTPGKQLALAIANSKLLPSGEMSGADWKVDLARLTPDLYAQLDEKGIVSRMADGERYYKGDIGKLVTHDNKASVSVQFSPKTPEFKKWFGDSKVVDENGEPLEVYRGDGEEIVDYTKGRRRSPGLFFASDRRRAEGYGNVRAFYLRAENPLDLRGEAHRWYTRDGKAKEIIDDLFESYYARRTNNETGEMYALDDLLTAIEYGYLWQMDGLGGWSMSAWTRLQELAEANGYDGLIAMDSGEGGEAGLSYVVFDGHQVKSAANEKPTDSPDIRFSPKRVDEISKTFTARVETFFEKKGTQPVELAPNTPASLQVFGWIDHPIVIEAAVLNKMKFNHGLTAPAIGRLPYLLQRPGMIFADTKNDSLVFTGSLSEGKPALVAVKPERQVDTDEGAYLSNMVVTSFEPQRGWDEIAKRLMRGELVYRDTSAIVPKSVEEVIRAAQKHRAQAGRVLPREVQQGRAPRSSGRVQAAQAGQPDASVLLQSLTTSVERPTRVLYQSDLVKWETSNWGEQVLFSPKSPEMQRWLADSTVQDVVYHATAAEKDFTKFKRGSNDIGMHFGSAEQANDRAALLAEAKDLDPLGRNKKIRGSLRVLPVYLNLRNPIRLKDPGRWNVDNLHYQLLDLFPEARDTIRKLRTPRDIREFLEGRGYDGVVYRNTGEVKGGEHLRKQLDDAKIAAYGEKKNAPEWAALSTAARAYEEYREQHAEDSYIAFHPEQVKSVFNDKPTDSPNISMSPKNPFPKSTVQDVVYHGTDADFTAFAAQKDSELGFHFGSQEQANKMTRGAGIWRPARLGSRVIPAHLDLRNPLRTTDAGHWGNMHQVAVTLDKALGGDIFRNLSLKNITKNKVGDAFRQKNLREIRSKLQSMGYDGIVYRNRIEGKGDSYIVFEPTQVKSIFNDDPAPSAQFSPKIVGDSRRQYTAAQRQMFQNTGRTVEVPSLRTRIADLRKDLGKKLAQGLVDQFAPIKELSPMAYMLARLSKGSAGAFEALLRHGKLVLRGGAYDADRSGGFVEKVGIPLQGELEDFLWWVAANRADRLSKEDREHLFSAQDIVAGKTLADGKTTFDYRLRGGTTTRSRNLIYADALKSFDEFNKNALDMAEQSGLINPESRKLWEHEFYVPFYRVSEEDGGFIGAKMGNALVRQRAFKHLKGGNQKLNSDLLANTLANWAHLIDASAKNRAAKASLEAAAQMGVAVEADKHTVAAMAGSIGKKGSTVWFMDQGAQRHFLVDDPYVMTAITSLEYAGMKGPLMDALSTMKHVLTVGVTASPAFKVRNLIRDSLQAIGTAPIGYNPLGNIKEGFAASKHSTQTYVSALASGGLIRFGTMLEGRMSDRVRQLVKAGIKDTTILDSDAKFQAMYDRLIEPAVAAYNELGNRSEEITRAALYKQLTDKGMDHAQASLMVRDLMDFSMQGSWTGIRFLTQVVPFMNARMQGLYKLGRGAKEDPKRFAAVLGATALFSIALLAAYGDDDDWKKREDWDRDNFWWFKMGGTAFRIPKPFEIGAIATLAERGVEYFSDPEMTGERLNSRVLSLLANNLSMNPVPQLVKPIVDVYANQDSFTGRPIESMGMERLQPDYRFTSRSSMAARAASTTGQAITSATGVDFLSPVQIDHMLKGYFGWLGSFVVGASEMVARPVSGQPTRPAGDTWRFATQGFISELPADQSRYVSQLYEQAKVLEQAYGTYQQLLKQGKSVEAKEFLDENRDKLVKYKNVEAVKRAESKYNERIRIIERSALDPNAKRTAIAAIAAEKDRVARLVK